MLSPRGCVSPYLGRGPVRDMSLPNEWGQAPFVPQGHCFEGGSGPPGQGCPSSDGRQGGHRLRTLPLLKVGGGGGQPAWPCHCWSERERAARDRELSISKGLKSKPNKKGTKEGTKEYAIPFKVLSSFHYAMDCISFITYTCLHQHV